MQAPQRTKYRAPCAKRTRERRSRTGRRGTAKKCGRGGSFTWFGAFGIDAHAPTLVEDPKDPMYADHEYYECESTAQPALRRQSSAPRELSLRWNPRVWFDEAVKSGYNASVCAPPAPSAPLVPHLQRFHSHEAAIPEVGCSLFARLGGLAGGHKGGPGVQGAGPQGARRRPRLSRQTTDGRLAAADEEWSRLDGTALMEALVSGRVEAVEGLKARHAYSDKAEAEAKAEVKAEEGVKGAGAGTGAGASAGCARRIMRELRRELPRALDLGPRGAMFVRFDEEAMQFMRALVTGVEGTPYACGAFVFDIFCPADYPQTNCLVKHITPGANTVKGRHTPGGFSPNLHADSGKVCLSLLGTWQGVGWKPGKSNIYQVLSSIQWMIFGATEPYYMEPGHGGWEGTVAEQLKKNGGKHRPEAVWYRELVEAATATHAILAPLRACVAAETGAGAEAKHEASGDGTAKAGAAAARAPAAMDEYRSFRSVLRAHFRSKRRAIVANLRCWIARTKSAAHRERLQAVQPQIEGLLARLVGRAEAVRELAAAEAQARYVRRTAEALELLRGGAGHADASARASARQRGERMAALLQELQAARSSLEGGRGAGPLRTKAEAEEGAGVEAGAAAPACGGRGASVADYEEEDDDDDGDDTPFGASDDEMMLVVALLLLGAEHAHAAAPRVLYVAPPPLGSDANSGASSAAPLASCRGAARAVASVLNASLPASRPAIEVRFAPGRYYYNDSTSCANLALRGTAEAPIVFRGAGANSSAVVFDGSVPLADAGALTPVTNATVLRLINPTARGQVLQLRLPAMAMCGALDWDGQPLTPSEWPNGGYVNAYVQRVNDPGTVYCQGRTVGPPPVCNLSAPCGANLTLADPQPRGDWAAELAAGPGFGVGAGASATGYFSNDWYRETHRLARVGHDGASANGSTWVAFESYSRYTICESIEKPRGACGGTAPGRFIVRGLLCEVDTPGEYFWDRAARVLYLIPPAGAAAASALSARAAGTFFSTTEDASHITLRGVTVQGSVGTLVAFTGGTRNTVGGCTLRNAAGGVSLSGGTGHRVIGNDIYDTGGHVSTGGGGGAAALHDRTDALVMNNHLTSRFTSGAWGIAIRGTGDRFARNLAHDAPGQLVTPGGPLVMLDHNEIFNTGFVEGDGGVVYAGASLVAGYGASYRENFLHHSLEVPGLHGRGGIYFDDHLQAVANCSHNVLYKVAGRSVLVNGGGGSNVTRNLFINGGIGVYNQGYDDMTADLPLYDNGTLRRGDKGDYIWKTEQALGVRAYPLIWGTEFASRFPTFAARMRANSTQVGWASPAGSNFRDNVFLNMSGNVCFRRGFGAGDQVCDGQLPSIGADAFVDVAGALEAQWAWFPRAAELEFVNQSLGIDTRGAGLVCDEFRRALPDPARYRPWVKRFFEGVPSAAPAGEPYTPGAAAVRSALRSGAQLVQWTAACPPLEPADCRGAWLAWGECEANRTKVVRWTTERFAQAGGRACDDEEGATTRVPC
eukprot:g1911.t1